MKKWCKGCKERLDQTEFEFVNISLCKFCLLREVKKQEQFWLKNKINKTGEQNEQQGM